MLTPGEIAYNAYCNESGWKSLVSDKPLPAFDMTAQRIRDAWEAAAQAVIKYVNEGPSA